jgi:hypothetical protein
MTVGGTIRLDKKRSECRMSEVWYCMYAFDCNLEVAMMGITFVIILPEAEAALLISSSEAYKDSGTVPCSRKCQARPRNKPHDVIHLARRWDRPRNRRVQRWPLPTSIRSQWGDGEFYWQALLTELGVWLDWSRLNAHRDCQDKSCTWNFAVGPENVCGSPRNLRCLGRLWVRAKVLKKFAERQKSSRF